MVVSLPFNRGAWAVLVYRCPNSNRQVTTEIATTAQAVSRLGSLKLSLWCPYCETGHIVCASDTHIGKSS
jgi:hypothetical protein